MKIAIIGDSPKAIAAVKHFYDIQADVTWFCEKEPNWSHSNFKFSDEKTFKQYYEEEYKEEKEKIASKVKINDNNVLRVMKRFLLKNEEISGRSRLADLFRVVFEIEPQVFIEEHQEKNPQFFQNLKFDMKELLEEKIEHFSDFDLVVDAQFKRALDMGTSAPCVRELSLRNRLDLYYGVECFSQKTNDYQEIALIGSGEMAAQFLLSLRTWLKNKENRIFIVTTEESPFASVSNIPLKKELDELIDEQNRLQEEEVEAFLKKREEWNQLESYMQAKIKRPEEPIPQVVYFAGHNVTSVDALVDQRKFYLTCEIPPFRRAQVQKENAHLDLKTIGVQAAFVLTGNEVNLELYESLKIKECQDVISEEPGVYFLGYEKNESNEETKKLLNRVQRDVEVYFSRH